MKRSIYSVLVSILYLFSVSTAYAALSFKTAIYESVTEGPMMKSSSTYYSDYDNNLDKAISSEWRTETIMGRQTRSLIINKQGKVYNVDLDTRQCTVTDISGITNAIHDPEDFAKSLKQQMNFQESGTCSGAGLQGKKYTSSFGEMCFYDDVFMLWQKTMGTHIRVTKVEFDKKLPKDKISLPAGIKCTEGPDLSKGFEGFKSPGINEQNEQNEQQSEMPARDEQQPSQQDIENAIEQAKDAMKQLFGN